VLIEAGSNKIVVRGTRGAESLLRVEERNGPRGPGAAPSTMDGMETKMLEVSLGVPRQLWDHVELAARDDSTPVSALVAEALAQHLARRARLRSVEAWARLGGAAEFDELAEADPVFEAAGCA
jgi:hypothetical protein